MEASALTTPGSSAPGRRLRGASDERLVAGLRGGDERCFEVIYDRYHRPLLAFCRHMLGTREEAEDALQHVFVVAHRQLCADTREILLRPWLYTVARNRCLSLLRARRQTVALEDVPEACGDGLAVAAEVEQRQDLKDMLSDLARLPEDQRAALVLAELEDLTHDEIAIALDVRREKVKALVFQARESLMGYRQARLADCGPVREQLATLRGSALRRAPLQRHVAVCPACAQFKAEVTRQRATLAAVLPVIPALGLKDQILGAVHAASASAPGAAAAGSAAVGLGAAAGTGATAAGSGAVTGGAAALSGGSGLLAAVGSSGLVVKSLVVVALAASAGGGAVAISTSDGDRPPPQAPAAARTSGATAPAGTTGAAAAPGQAPTPGHSGAAPGAAAGRAGSPSARAGHGRSPGRTAAPGSPASTAPGAPHRPVTNVPAAKGRPATAHAPATGATTRRPAQGTVKARIPAASTRRTTTSPSVTRPAVSAKGKSLQPTGSVATGSGPSPKSPESGTFTPRKRLQSPSPLTP